MPEPAPEPEHAPAPAPAPVPATMPVEPIPGPQSAPQPRVEPPSEDTVAMLTGMGFPRDYVLAALRAAHNDPQLAVHFRTEGGMPTDDGDDGGEDDGEDDGDDGDDLLPEGAESDPAAFEALTANPQFQQLRALLRAQPQMLEMMLNQLQQSNPAIYRIIMANREAFSRWLSSDAPVPGTGTVPPVGTVPAPVPPPAQRIQVSAEDRAAIDQLMALGFSEPAAVQAFFACDKNVDLAANFLFEHGDF